MHYTLGGFHTNQCPNLSTREHALVSLLNITHWSPRFRTEQLKYDVIYTSLIDRWIKASMQIAKWTTGIEWLGMNDQCLPSASCSSSSKEPIQGPRCRLLFAGFCKISLRTFCCEWRMFGQHLVCVLLWCRLRNGHNAANNTACLTVCQHGTRADFYGSFLIFGYTSLSLSYTCNSINLTIP